MASGNPTRCLYYKPQGLKSEELKELAEALNEQCEHARMPAAVSLVNVEKLKEKKPVWLTDVPMLGMLEAGQQQLHLYPYLDAAEWLTSALQSFMPPPSAVAATPTSLIGATSHHAHHSHGKHAASPLPAVTMKAPSSRSPSNGVSQEALERRAQQMEAHENSPRFTDTEEPLTSTRDGGQPAPSGPKRRHAKGPPLPSASDMGGRMLD
jgi:hypothetical protein